MNIHGHLCLEEVRLSPSMEWTDSSLAWRFVRVSQGSAYWLSSALTRQLAVGDVVVASPKATGTLRASQLGEVRLHGFYFRPEWFSGFFTLAERHYFETMAVRTKPPVQILPADHPVGRQYAALVEQNPVGNDLFQRCRVLDILAGFFGDDLKRQRPPATPSTCAFKRFQQLIEHMSDQEITHYTPRQLAELCGCSLRHFSRIFRDHFGSSPRAKQIEYRLLKARQLLSGTDDKIIHVAIESGFRNLGLFNALFKKYVGVTPSEWRQRHARNGNKPGLLAVLALAGFVAVATVLAQTGPADKRAVGGPPSVSAATSTNEATRAGQPPSDPGQEKMESREERLQRIEREVEAWRLLQRPKTTNALSATNAVPAERSATGGTAPTAAQAVVTNGVMVIKGAPASIAVTNRPPANTNAGPVFEVRGYEVRGNTLLPVDIVAPILQKHTGASVTFETIRAAQAEFQMAYRDRGYVTVSVGLPQQELTNGIVKVQVTEGRLVEINVVSQRYFSSNNVMRALPSLRTNIFLNSLVFQPEVDRANGSRDRTIYPVIAPGPEPGTTSLKLRVVDRFPLHGRFELNNNSTPGTPELRMNTALQYNNLWQLEHQLGVQYSFTPTDMKSPVKTGAALTSPTHEGPFYEQPMVASYSAFYRMPLSGVNGPSRQREYSVSDFGYDEVTQKFRAPPPEDARELLFYASRSSSDTDETMQDHTTSPTTVPAEGGFQVTKDIFLRTLTVNENLGMRLLQPLRLSRAMQSSFSLGLDWKQYAAQSLQRLESTASDYVITYTNAQGVIIYDKYPGPFTNRTQQITSKTLTYLPIQLSWEGSVSDRYGSTSLGINNSFHWAGLISDKKDFANLAGTNANGNYYIFTASLTREQKISGGWGVRLHADGQWANQPLISNEQFGLGGAAGVRGYRDGQDYGDTGWRVQCEPHTPYLNLGMVDGTQPLQARFSAFVDYGERYLLDPGPRAGTVPLFGAGVAVAGNIGQHLDFRVTFGLPFLDTPVRKAGDWRLLFGLGAQF